MASSSDVAATPRIFIIFIIETPDVFDYAGPAPMLGISSARGLSEAIHIPLVHIMQSQLVANDVVEGIFVNINDGECFQVNPHPTFYRRESSFVRMLEALKANGVYSAPITHEVMLERFADGGPNANRGAIAAHLPPNTYKIGCTSGEGPGVSFEDHIASVVRDIPIAVVLGNVTSGAAASYGLDTTLNVSQYDLTTATCALNVVTALENKYIAV